MSSQSPTPQDPAELQAAIASGHEDDYVGSRIVWRAAVAFIAITLIGIVAVYVLQPLMVSMQEKEYPKPNPLAATYGRVEPPAPRLQVDPKLDIHDHRQAEQHLLDSYGWVDEKAGVVRIPVARAIDLLAQRGLPATTGDAGAPAATGATGATGGQP